LRAYGWNVKNCPMKVGHFTSREVGKVIKLSVIWTHRERGDTVSRAVYAAGWRGRIERSRVDIL
jgi:hypothetical protein